MPGCGPVIAANNDTLGAMKGKYRGRLERHRGCTISNDARKGVLLEQGQEIAGH
jgi:hypothetical protein